MRPFCSPVPSLQVNASVLISSMGCWLQVGEGQLVLMDAGCEYHGYASDVTRTWPVGGRYTPEQRQVYEMVVGVRQK